MAAVIPRASEQAEVTVDWRRFGALVALLCLVVALYWPAARSLGALWVNGDLTTYTHGYLILAIACWLLWRARASVAEPDSRPFTHVQRFAVASGLLLAALCWQFAWRAGIQIAVELLLLPILWWSVLAFFGRRAARAAALPIAYLIFAIDIWDYFNPLAQWTTIYAVRFLLRVAEIPAYFVGNEVHLPSGVIEIAHGCSGLHFIMVGLAVGTLIGALRDDHWRARLRWMALAFALAVLVNWVRVFTIIAVAHYTRMQHYLIRQNHYYFGWMLFAVALALLFYIERRTPLHPARAINVTTERPALREGFPALRAAVLLMLLATPLILNALIEARLRSQPVAADWPTIHFPAASRVSDDVDSSWNPIQFNADREKLLTVALDSGTLEAYAAGYREQHPAKKLGGYANHLGGSAQLIERGASDVDGRQFGTSIVEDDGHRFLLWFSYEVGGRHFVDATRAQLWYSWSTLWALDSVPSSAVAMRAPCVPDCNAARAVLEKFVITGGGPS